jgi:rubredoxin
MFEDTTGKSLDRRSFLRGSAVFAAALGIAVAPAFAQQQPPPQEKPKKEEPKKDPFETDKDKGEGEKKTLVDKEGREYRVCPQCAYNMYKQGRMWVCENCGYSYVE